MTITVFTCDQNSPEWLAARRGIPTASSFSKILAKGEGKTRRRYMLDLAAERLTGDLAIGFSNAHTERGHEMEDEARNLYAFQYDIAPQAVGFIRNDTLRVGASPDSLIDENGVLEIKTRLGALQLELLESGKMPSEHKAQVQGQLWVSGRDYCDFISYWPKLPLFHVRVERDDLYIANLAQEVEDFLGELDAIVSKYSPSELEQAA